MRNSKISHDSIRQNGENVKKPQKHDVNLQKNSTLYFQIGLIVCLLFTYGLFEMKFETTIPMIVINDQNLEDNFEMPVEEFKVFEEQKKEVKPEVKRQVVLNNNLKEVDNDFKLSEVIDVITSEQNITDSQLLDPGDIHVEKIDEDVPVPYSFIQNVPIYPGCEKQKTNNDRKKCMSEKITKLIQRKFQGDDIASEFGLQGLQKIDVQFTIDKTGKVKDIKTRAPHPKLEEETERVINLIPEMTPGRQNDKDVGVIYTLPIKFKAQ